MADASETEFDGELPESDILAPALGPASLLQELDARQNELLDQLEKLNARIEKVIAEWGGGRGEADQKPALPVAA